MAWRTGYDLPGHPYVVKAVKADSSEADIYERLSQFPNASPNHTLPCKVIRSDPPLLIMPAVSEFMLPFPQWTLVAILRCFDQVLEVRFATIDLMVWTVLNRNAQGVDFLHQLKIAHLVRLESYSVLRWKLMSKHCTTAGLRHRQLPLR